jgi:hemolysin D
VRIEQERDFAHQRARAAELTSAIAQAAQEQAAYTAEFRRIVAATLNEAEKRAADLAQDVVEAEQKRRLTRLTAPVDGTVQQLAVFTKAAW